MSLTLDIARNEKCFREVFSFQYNFLSYLYFIEGCGDELE
jgi:hypothetical protein